MDTLNALMENPYLTLIVAIVGTARVTRLIGFDHWPPVEWLRAQWDVATENSGWNLLMHCPFCLTPWFAAGNLAWGYFTDWGTAWWVVNAWLAVSYAAAYVLIYDGSDD